MKMSIAKATISLLKRTRKNCLVLIDIKKQLCDLGYPIKSIHGVFSSGKSAMYNNSYFIKKWNKCISSENKEAAFVRNSVRDQYAVNVNYNTKEKQKSRMIGINILRKNSSPKIVILSGEDGIDVDVIRDKCPNAVIDNIERNKTILDSFSKKGYDTNNFHMSVAAYLNKDRDFKKLFMYDSQSYLSGSFVEPLKKINDTQMCEYLSLTMLTYPKNVRNDGRWVNFYKETWLSKNFKDTELSYLKRLFFNYELLETYNYKRNNSPRSKNMRTLLFRLR